MASLMRTWHARLEYGCFQVLYGASPGFPNRQKSGASRQQRPCNIPLVKIPN
uniref:Uncharacterized protein n=1 Tax=Bionectria ochroleuca TaxID=29856 RepID=A0A8H7KDZ9_BIOOC